MAVVTALLLIGVISQADLQLCDPQFKAIESERRQDPQQKLEAIYLHEATAYEIYLDSGRQEKLQFRSDPVYVYRNEERGGGTVFVWTHEGRAEVIGCILSYRAGSGQRVIGHEFHSLSRSILKPEYPGKNKWVPTGAIQLKTIPGAPVPAETSGVRQRQMRSLAREFTANTVRPDEGRWELRLLPQPLYHYENTEGEVLDGGIFAFVDGTDPAVILVVEARRTQTGPTWLYALARFHHHSLYVRHKEQEVWTAIRGPDNPDAHNADHTYHRCNEYMLEDMIPPE